MATQTNIAKYSKATSELISTTTIAPKKIKLIIMILSIGPISAIFMHRQPEDIGLLPDGVDPEATSIEGNQGTKWVDTEYSWTRQEALRTKALWVLLGVQTMGGIALMPTLLPQVAFIEA